MNWGGIFYDDNGEVITAFEGPQQIADFGSMLDHYRGNYSNKMGRLPIFMLPFLPKGDACYSRYSRSYQILERAIL